MDSPGGSVRLGEAGTGRAPESAPVPFVGARVESDRDLTAREVTTVDARQDELLAVESVEGRPMTNRLRRMEWRLVAIVLPMLAAAAVVGALVWRVSLGAMVGFGLLGAALLVLGGWPVLMAGILRERERKAARVEAVAEMPAKRG